MAKKRKPAATAESIAFDNELLGDKLPIVSTLKDCRQLSKDHWQGTHPDGALFDMRGGVMPPKQRLLVFNNDGRIAGFIRLDSGADEARTKRTPRAIFGDKNLRYYALARAIHQTKHHSIH
jgi:hypothetical protein